MSTKPPLEEPTPAQDAKTETRSAQAAPADPGNPPVTEILRRLEQVVDRLEAVCTHMHPAQPDDSLASALFSRLDSLEGKLMQLSNQASESTFSSGPVDAHRTTPELHQPPEPAPVDANVVEFLSASSRFAKYGAKNCVMVAQFMDRTVLAPGSVLFLQGQVGDALYVVKSGMLEIYKTDGAAEVHVADAPPGELVGEMALIDDLPRSASARAKKKSELLVLSRDSFRVLEKTYPPLAVELRKELLEILSARLRETTDKAVRR